MIGVLAQAKNGDKRTVLEINFLCIQSEDSTCTQSALSIFLFSFGGRERGQGIVFFFLCSQHVPFKFSMCSPRVFPIAPGFNPHMFCSKSSPSHLYRWAKGGGIPSFHKIFYLGEPISSIFQPLFFFAMGQSNWLIGTKKKVGLVVGHPQLINMGTE